MYKSIINGFVTAFSSARWAQPWARPRGPWPAARKCCYEPFYNKYKCFLSFILDSLILIFILYLYKYKYNFAPV